MGTLKHGLTLLHTYQQTSQLSSWHYHLIFGRPWDQISTEDELYQLSIFVGLKSFQANSRIVLKIRPWPLLFTSFATHYSLITLSFDILLTAIGLTPGGNSTVRLYKQTIHKTT